MHRAGDDLVPVLLASGQAPHRGSLSRPSYWLSPNFQERNMNELNAAAEATVTATQVVLPGKVEPSGLRLVQRALGAPAAGHALVRVESTAVSFAETAMRRGRYYGQPPFPFVPGYDLVGVVEAVGPGVDHALAGRRVAALTKTGGWASAVLLTAADLVVVPDGVSADEAETLVVNGLTAYQMLHRSAKVRAGQTVLVLGASGGVGTVLVQLARHAGARVIGTASTRHHQALRALGVEPVDYRDPDLAARVRGLAPGGVDAVFDHLGGASIDLSYRLLNRTGTLVSYSIASKLDDTSPVLLGFLALMAKLAVWNYLPTRKHDTDRPAARYLPCGRPFSAGPRSEPRGHVSVHVALQWRRRGGGEGARVDGLMAADADDERLPAHFGHEFGPRGLRTSRPGEVSELADLVNFHGRVLLAPLAPARAEPGDQLLADGCRDCRAVIKDRLLLPFQRDAAEPGDQWFPAWPLGDGLEAVPLAVRGVRLGLVLAGHVGHPGAVLGGECFKHGGLGGPFEPVQPPHVASEEVILNDAPVLGAVGADDECVIEVQQPGAALGFAVLEIRGAFRLDHRPGDAQPDRPVDMRAGLAVLDGDLVAEEGRRACPGVREQGLLLVEFQPEIITQERREAGPDFLCFGFRPGEPEEGIIGIPDIPQPPAARIIWVRAGQAALLRTQFPPQGAVIAGAGTPGRRPYPVAGRVGCPALSPGAFRHENCPDEFVHPVQVNIGEHGRDHAALRNAAQRVVVFPVLQVPGPEHLADEPQEPVVLDLLRQDRQHDLMVKTPETVRDITFDKPGCPGPRFRHLAQRGVAATSATETVRTAGELRLVIRLQQEPDHLANQLIRPGRHSEGPFLPVFLRDADPPHGLEPVALVAHRINDAADLAPRHAVRGFPVRPGCHRTLV